MIDISNVIFVHTSCVDMRKSINGLAILVSLSGAVFEHGKAFVFLNKARDKIKILLKKTTASCWCISAETKVNSNSLVRQKQS